MDAATINAKIYAGRGKAALRIGFDYQIHRPSGAGTPLNLVGTIKAAFNAADNTYSKPNLPGQALWFGDFDASQTLPGDYLLKVDFPLDAKFIAAQQSLLPIICVDCNHTVKITRIVQSANAGQLGYGGRYPANETTILGASAMWPCSILFGSSSAGSGVLLPAEVRQTGFRIMLPASVPLTLLPGDIVIDNIGRRFSVEGVESSDTGLRIHCTEAHA